MATRQSKKIEPPKVIGAISKFAGTLVGTAVVTGKRIVKTATQAEEEPLGKARKKTVRRPAGKKKKAIAKTKTKGRKVKKKTAARTKAKSRKVKKKVAKQKSTASVKSPVKKVKKQKRQAKKS
jgi:hypothetical protein